MRLSSRTLLLAAFAASVVSYSSAQNAPAAMALNTPPAPLAADDPTTVLRVTVPEVPVIFTVLDRKGQFVNGLERADFHIYDAGSEVPRLTFFESKTEMPLKIAVLIDLSGSLKHRVKFEAEVTRDFLSGVLREGDSAYVIGFNDHPHVTDRSNSVAELLQISAVRPDAGTAIFDAMSLAARTLGPTTANQRSVVVLMTDGDDTCSKATEEEVMRVLSANGTTVIVLDSGADVSSDPTGSLALLHRLAEQTGGEVIRATSLAAVRKAFKRAELALRSQYALAFRPNELKSDGSFHRLKLKTRAGLRIRCRRGYFAPTAAD